MREGLVAEFEGPDAFAAAHERLRELGCTRLESWSPYPVRGVLTKLPKSRVPWIMLASGLSGVILAYVIQWWCNAVDYRLDVGGRPYDSVPAFIPICFETGVLFAALAGFVSVLALSGLPRLYHPMFEVKGFERAAVDRFWLGVDAADPLMRDERGRIRDELTASGALRCESLGSPGVTA